MIIEEVKTEELVISNMYSIEAVVQLLIEKGFIDKQEILDRIKSLQKSDQRESRKN